ncbi:DUF1501 domain-containing protein [Antarcticimicrobium sediminis]|uniref:DUF1501 domain-containing protein n=1 Tax=Antarcticimicrobium sediminis TaxID=2546227 RepID=A0A4R5EQ79_9RHOB|nr:DUF1501 domain-containing protein [Antarcticimicrobium sediminis]TDE36680.1 DUF1501 domain-containing protein [Antarcticimicrobium sediminis]
MIKTLSRRAFLARSAVLGCSAAASPFLTRVSYAAAPWDTRLVVIILRGGMDGLDVVQPYGAPGYGALRRDLAGGPTRGASDLDGFFALHPALAPLMPLWARGELGFVHAVSTPYRDKRSHFDGQDLLEAGTADLGMVRDGWLNRMLQLVPGVEAQTAFALGHGEMKVLAGQAPVADWSPEAELSMSPQAERLMEMVMQDDPLFHPALTEALMLSRGTSMAVVGDMAGGDDGEGMMQPPRAAAGKGMVPVAQFAAEQLRGDSRVVSFSINGWDTHRNQGRVLGGALGNLAETITTLKDGVGAEVWGKTAVVAMTEFGRTVHENGTGGTDHGTGGAMVLAGGALRGGQVHGRWPGLDEASLYDRRDLMPTGDVRAAAAWILRGVAGLDRAGLERSVFPGLDMGDDPRLLR